MRHTILNPLLFLTLLCIACREDKATTNQEGNILVDEDADGFLSDVDCNDTNPDIHPEATEACDGIDNNCDGIIDEDLQSWFYQDSDADGFGDALVAQYSCEVPDGYVENNTDCNDEEATINPSADEQCDELDNNCNGTVDEAVGIEVYLDRDEDGFGDDTSTTFVCEITTGTSNVGGDCDDRNQQIYPQAPEICDTMDNNCNGTVDEGVQNTYYADVDDDGFGDINTLLEACTLPEGAVENADDCDDLSSDIAPGMMENCDGMDNNCDGTVDEEGALGSSLWFIDSDEDGFGDSTSSMLSCSAPAGYVDNDIDCDDSAANIHPNAAEICDSIDNNCNGLIDDDDSTLTDGTTWFLDSDGDGFGDDANSISACEPPSGYASQADDCDDDNDAVNPDATEACDGIDNNCDGALDDDVIGSSQTCPALQCQDILNNEPNATDGAYWIQPDDTLPAFEAWCDMTTDDGGWTLLITLDPSTTTFATVEDWPDYPEPTGSAPTYAGLYKGSLAEFSEVREEIASGSVVAYGSYLSESSLNVIRQLYGYNSRLIVAPSLTDPPSCSLSYGTPANITGCSSRTTSNNDTIIGWAVDPTSTYNVYCWFARGNCCSTAGGSSQCNGETNGSQWARTWFR